MSDWMQVMLEEIASKRAEREADFEEYRRRRAGAAANPPDATAPADPAAQRDDPATRR